MSSVDINGVENEILAIIKSQSAFTHPLIEIILMIIDLENFDFIKLKRKVVHARIICNSNH